MVDIGTNSMRLLITDGTEVFGRWVEVTGLGQGVDETGVLSEEAMDRTVAALGRFGGQMAVAGVDARAAIATSATRDASNREQFLNRAELALGVRPEVISGGREGILSFDGATIDFDVEGPVWVSDIGGGSTEIVMYDDGYSIQLGSVRLTERLGAGFPLTTSELRRARHLAAAALTGYEFGEVVTHIGVAGTWTSLVAISLDLDPYDDEAVHGRVLTTTELNRLVEFRAGLTLEQTEAIASLDPRRAPVIRCGAIVAEAVVEVLGVDSTLISVKDSLDGLAAELLP